MPTQSGVNFTNMFTSRQLLNMYKDSCIRIQSSRQYLLTLLGSSAGVGNSFGFAGHIRDKLGIRGPVHVHV